MTQLIAIPPAAIERGRAELAPLRRSLVDLFLDRCAPGSHGTYKNVLRSIAREYFGVGCPFDETDKRLCRCPWLMPWHLIGPMEMGALRSWLAQRFSPSHANKGLSAVRGVLKRAWREAELISTDRYHRTIDVERIKGVRAKPATGRRVHQSELLRMVKACAGQRFPRRDRAMLALLACAGLRRAEVVGLDTDSFVRSFDQEALPFVQLEGKNNRERVVPIPQVAWNFIEPWLEEMTAGHPSGRGPLFPSTLGYRFIWFQHLSPEQVGRIIKRVRVRAQVAPLTPHDFRRTYCSALLDAGVDLATVQQMMGHADPSTTAGYSRREHEAACRGARTLWFPTADELTDMALAA